MADYKLYFLDLSNDVAAAKEFECKDDDDAIAKALLFEDGRNLELWSGDRVVARMAPLHRRG